MPGLQQQLQRQSRLGAWRMLLAILRDFLHRPGVVALDFHLRQLEAAERIGLDPALGDAVIDKAAHRLLEECAERTAFSVHDDLQGVGQVSARACGHDRRGRLRGLARRSCWVIVARSLKARDW